MTEQLYGLETNYVDWHHFLLCAALPFPWPLPTAQDLLEAWQALVLVSDRNTVGKKMVDKDHFMGTEIWLDKPPEYREEVTGSFDRNKALKHVSPVKQPTVSTCQHCNIEGLTLATFILHVTCMIHAVKLCSQLILNFANHTTGI